MYLLKIVCVKVRKGSAMWRVLGFIVISVLSVSPREKQRGKIATKFSSYIMFVIFKLNNFVNIRRYCCCKGENFVCKIQAMMLWLQRFM